MFKKVAPYIGENKKYTITAVILMSIGIIANVVPYFYLYQIIAPLMMGESIDTGFILVRVIAVAVLQAWMPIMKEPFRKLFLSCVKTKL